MVDPNLRWDGRQWLYWDGYQWLQWDGWQWLLWNGYQWVLPQAYAAVSSPGGYPAAAPQAKRAGVTGIVVAGIALGLAMLMVLGGGLLWLAVGQFTGGLTAEEKSAYEQGMDGTIDSLNEYWEDTMPAQFERDWIPPSKYVPFHRPDQPGPDCNGEPDDGEFIAWYCSGSNDDYIAWDEAMFQRLYDQWGPVPGWVLMAHEFGHNAQAVLWVRHNGIPKMELQAHCFAGSWAAWAQAQGRLPEDAQDRMVRYYRSRADTQGNSGEQELAAYRDGVDGGATACYQRYAPD